MYLQVANLYPSVNILLEGPLPSLQTKKLSFNGFLLFFFLLIKISQENIYILQLLYGGLLMVGLILRGNLIKKRSICFLV